MATASVTQTAFRGRNDDGSESAATWKANANTNWTQDTNTTFRIRLAAQEVNAKTFNLTPNLFYSRNGGGYTQVTTSSSVAQLVASQSVSDGTATTQQISSGTFVAGAIESDGSVSGVGINNSVTEMEYVLQLRYADLAQNDTVAFRIYNGTSALNSYTNTPTVTVNMFLGSQTVEETAQADRAAAIAATNDSVGASTLGNARVGAIAAVTNIIGGDAATAARLQGLLVAGGMVIEETLYDVS